MNLTINLMDPEEVAIALDMLQRLSGDQAPTTATPPAPTPTKTTEDILISLNVTLETLRAVGGQAAAKDKAAMRAAVKKYGANLSDISEDDYAPLLADFQEIINA